MSAPLLRRRSLLLGGASTLGTTGCGLGIPPAPHAENLYRFEKESLIAGEQANCAAIKDAPRDLGWAPRMMRVREAWEYSAGEKRPAYGRDIVIGHVDTGVADHVELQPSKDDPRSPVLWGRGYDFIDDVPGGYDPLIDTPHLEQIGHGTATASVMVSRGGIDKDAWPTDSTTCGGTKGPGRITGVAPAAFVLPARAFRLAASSEHERIARAIDFLREQKVDVITMALGWPDRKEVVETAIVKAIEANIVVLAAAGNFVDTVTYPQKAATPSPSAASTQGSRSGPADRAAGK